MLALLLEDAINHDTHTSLLFFSTIMLSNEGLL